MRRDETVASRSAEGDARARGDVVAFSRACACAFARHSHAHRTAHSMKRDADASRGARPTSSKSANARSVHATTTKVRKSSGAAAADDGFDVDDLFKGAKARSTKPVKASVKAEKAPAIRVLLPGQKKPKQKRTTAEFTPVDKPRRFEDGLPVYKSYGDFSDMKAGQVIEDNGGACPFDCNCCF